MIAPHIGGKIRLFSRYARGLPFSCILGNSAGPGRLFSELRVISSMDLNGELFGLTRRFLIGTASASLQLSETGCSQGIQASSAVSQKKIRLASRSDTAPRWPARRELYRKTRTERR